MGGLRVEFTILGGGGGGDEDHVLSLLFCGKKRVDYIFTWLAMINISYGLILPWSNLFIVYSCQGQVV